MATRKESTGLCQFCGKAFAKRSVSKHLDSCIKAQETIAAANAKTTPKEDTLYHLVIQDKYAKDFWLHLEMTGSATLKKLDEYLRAIWLECCGHMSEFSLDGFGREVKMSTQAHTIFERYPSLLHLYDFGTTSETLVKVVGKRTGKPLSKHPIFLLARNQMPIMPCMECNKPATWLCNECIYEEDQSGLLCDEHVENHPHQDNYGEPIELVNSPRMGMCGYEGPAEPPY